MTCQLIVLVAVPAMLTAGLAGPWAIHAARGAEASRQVARLAALGQQVAGLSRDMADERSGSAAFISGGRPAAGLAGLRRQYAITDNQAARVRRLVSAVGPAYPAQTRASAAQVLASIAKLPGLRREVARGQVPALAVITGYSVATAGLSPASDGIADVSGSSTLTASVRALGSLSRMIDDASRQQAILQAALAEGHFGPGALTALTTARARQASDLASFRGSATPEESGALTETLARPLAQQARAVEQRAIAAGDGALALGPRASQQWSAGMSYLVDWMGHAEQQLADWITADAQASQRSTLRSALITGGAGLGALVLIVLATLFPARSMTRRMRRLEAAALAGAGARPPDSGSAASTGFLWRNHSLLERLRRMIDSLELNEPDPERLANLFEMDHLATRIWRNTDSALVLAGHDTPRAAEPLALVDVLRAAASHVEEYARVVLDVQDGVHVSGSAATDTVLLLAELLENATTFSPQKAQVSASGHLVRGGGSLITITDGGTGMSEEELRLRNEQLASPCLTDMAAARRLGLLTVAHLAARHGITVTLSTPPEGGTTAEVRLPAALVPVAGERGGRQGPAGVAALGGPGPIAGAGLADVPFSALRFASRPEPPLGTAADMPEAVPLPLGAPVPSPAAGTSAVVTGPGPAGTEPGDGLPIFESVSRAIAQPPAAGDPAATTLPRRVPRPGQVHGADVDQEAQPAPVAESAEITRSKLASFQRGSRRAQAMARMNGGAGQPGQNG